jgi:predicted enzyme related to lactoylglutathione lyase
MLLGLRTVIYSAPDLASAKAWYSDVFGITPYFDEPFYVGFDVGGYELGLDPGAGTPGPGGSVAYWGVADLTVALARVLERGAAPVAPAQDVGGGIRVATVADPAGNLIGLIENPHFQLPPSAAGA